MRKKWCNSGVSEVVGTILILLMTVVLFASIIVWVSTIPTPQASIRLDMDGQLSPFFDGAGNWAGANITVVHRGGERLLDFRTTIFLLVQRGGAFTSESLTTRGEVLGLPYGIDGPDTDWDTGERWTYTNYSLLPTDLVQVTVVDTIRSLILWNEPLLGPEGAHPPLFVEKWADRLPETPTIDVLWTRRTFGIHARVSDADGDLNRNSVYVYLAFLFGTPLHRPPARMYDDGDPMHGDLRANDGIYSFRDSNLTPSTSWDGGIVIFNATDLRGNTATSRLVLAVEEGPPLPGGTPGFGGTWNSTLGGIGQGDSGPEGDYGYNIYDEAGLPTVDNPAGTPTRNFSPGERVYVIARSTVIRNLENINSFILRDSEGNKLYPPTKEFDSRDPTKNDPAFTQTATTPYFEYQYNFTAPGLLGAYGVEFTLKDNAGHAPFFATDRIWITIDGGSPVNYPKILTYKGPSGWDPRVSGIPSNLILD
ncbi:MAG: type IV pilin N-terminal domain-containing protein, partial [Euryarchaeota archaeon]|nr:type IV pilin N-terminal domain-containing protein [Euryarchaeota archaeon]